MAVFFFSLPLSSAGQSESMKALASAVECEVGGKTGVEFLKLPTIRSVTGQEMSSRVAGKEKGGVAGSEIAIFGATYLLSPKYSLPFWAVPNEDEALICMDRIQSVSRPEEADKFRPEKIESVMTIFGLSLALNDFLHNNCVRFSWLGRKEEFDGFNAIRWGHSWHVAGRVCLRAGLAEAFKAATDLLGRFDGEAVPGTSAGVPLSAYFAQKLSEGYRFCQGLEPAGSGDADRGFLFWRGIYSTYPFSATMGGDRRARMESEEESRMAAESLEWSLFVHSLNLKSRFAETSRCVSRSRTPDKLDEADLKGSRPVHFRSSVHESNGGPPGSSRAFVAILNGGSEAKECFGRLDSRWRGTLKSRCLGDFSLERSRHHKIGGTILGDKVGGSRWSGSLYSCMGKVKPGPDRVPVALVVARCGSRVVSLFYWGHQPSVDEVEVLGTSMFRAALEGPNTRFFDEGWKYQFTFDQIRVAMGHNFRDILMGKEEATSFVHALLDVHRSAMRESCEGPEVSGAAGHWNLYYRYKPPMSHMFYTIRIDSNNETITIDRPIF